MLHWYKCKIPYLQYRYLVNGTFGSVTTVPFRPAIQITLFLPFQTGEKAIFTAETVAGSLFTKQALIHNHFPQEPRYALEHCIFLHTPPGWDERPL